MPPRRPGQPPRDFPVDVQKLRPDPKLVVPDLTDAVEGWRAWGVPRTMPRYGVPPKLYSVTYGNYYWAPRKAMVATCSYRCDAEDVPGEQCSCGFYSAKTLEHLMSMGYHQYDAEANGYYHVVGQVANWGKVIEGSQGWRAQKAYPKKLYVPFEAWPLAKPLSKAYGVPVELKNVLVQPERRRK